jgi:hypothetical protein
MAKLEILVKTTADEEFETTPVADNPSNNPQIPQTESQTKALIGGATLLTLGRQAVSSGVNLIGDLSGDYALERKVKSLFTIGGKLLAVATFPQGAVPALILEEASGAIQRNRAVQQKRFEVGQNKIITGATRSNNSRKGGRK